MKNLKALLLVAIPLVMMACNDGTNQNQRNDDSNKNKNNEDRENLDRSNSGKDTVNAMSFMPFSKPDQDNNDQEFVKEAASSSLMEIQLGKLAQQNASNPRVKKFGEMMVRDHTKASDELKSLASGKNIDVPAELDDKHQKMIDDVRDEQGDEFDKAYIKAMAGEHDKGIDLFQKQSDNGSDGSLKAFASKNLAVLMMHRDSVKAIQRDLK